MFTLPPEVSSEDDPDVSPVRTVTSICPRQSITMETTTTKKRVSIKQREIQNDILKQRNSQANVTETGEVVLKITGKYDSTSLCHGRIVAYEGM